MKTQNNKKKDNKKQRNINKKQKNTKQKLEDNINLKGLKEIFKGFNKQINNSKSKELVSKKIKERESQKSKEVKELNPAFLVSSKNFVEKESESLDSRLKGINPFLEQTFEEDKTDFRDSEVRNSAENNLQASSRDLNQSENYFSPDYINNNKNNQSIKENFEIQKFNPPQNFQFQKNNVRNMSLNQDFNFDFQNQSINLNQWQNTNTNMGNFNNEMNFEEAKSKDYERYLTNPEEITEKNKLPFQKKKL